MKINTVFNSIIDKMCKDDDFVGEICIKDNQIKEYKLYFKKDKRKQKREYTKSDLKNIVIVLESPHIAEFKDAEFIAPALGATGNNLQNKFVCILKDCLIKNKIIIEDGKYNLCLMNAVQFQCSAGYKPNILRDLFWLRLWLKEEKERDFISRLESKSPSLIINLCTKGDHRGDKRARKGYKTLINHDYLEKRVLLEKEIINRFEKKMTLQGFVNIAIKNSKLSSIPLIIGCHPSSWRGRKNMKFIRCN